MAHKENGCHLTTVGHIKLIFMCIIQWSPMNSHGKCAEKSCELSEHANDQAYFMLSNITLGRVVYQTIMQIIREVRISEGQIIRATLYMEDIKFL